MAICSISHEFGSVNMIGWGWTSYSAALSCIQRSNEIESMKKSKYRMRKMGFDEHNSDQTNKYQLNFPPILKFKPLIFFIYFFISYFIKGALKAHIHFSLYESNTLQEQNAALLFLSLIPWGEIFAYCHHPAQPLAATGHVFQLGCRDHFLPLCLSYAPLSSFATQ